MVDDRCLSKDDANIANFYIIRAYSAIFSVLINMLLNMLINTEKIAEYARII